MSRHGQDRIARAMFLLAPLGLALSFLLSSCTVIGLAAGSISDRAAGKGNADRLLRVSQGSRVTLWLHDGSKVHGRLMGFAGLPDSLQGTLPRYLPPGSGVVMRVGSVQRAIPATDVRRVSVAHSSGKVVGATVGLLLDAGLVLLIALAASGAGLR